MSTVDLLSINLLLLPLQPHRCEYVLSIILAQYNWRHSTKKKGVSNNTAYERARLYRWMFTYLRDETEKHYKLDPRSFGGRHVDALMAYWSDRAIEGTIRPATIQAYYSHVKTFTRWIGKPSLMKPIGAYFPSRAHFTRNYCATSDKSWRAAGVDVETIIQRVEAYDVHAAASLRLMRAFGLRFKESVMLRPHVDVVTAAQAGKSGGPDLPYLDTHRGTKGGRRRYMPIESDAARFAVDHARSVTRRPEDSVSDPSLTLVKAMRRLRYVMERFEITKKDLGVVPHGLRHQFAGDTYAEITGVAPPVAGGRLEDKGMDEVARLRVSGLLGHGRKQITNAYLGSAASAASPGSLDVATRSESSPPA
jgi:integrase